MDRDGWLTRIWDGLSMMSKEEESECELGRRYRSTTRFATACFKEFASSAVTFWSFIITCRSSSHRQLPASTCAPQPNQSVSLG